MNERINELENLVKNIELIVYYETFNDKKRYSMRDRINNTEPVDIWMDFDHIRIAFLYSYFIINKPQGNLYFYDSLKQYSEDLNYDELVDKFDEMIIENRFIKNDITKKYNSNPEQCNKDIFIKNYLSNKLSEINAKEKANYIINCIISNNNTIRGHITI